MWFDKLAEVLEDRGSKPSISDPCMFLSDIEICLVYVDDCLLFTNKQYDINEVISSFRVCGDKFKWEMAIGKKSNRQLFFGS